MARTQALDYEQRQEAILAQASRLFAARGFKGTSLADVADACGMSKSLIYHYHPSKEDILFAVMASHVDQLQQDVADADAEGGGPGSRLKTIIHRFMEHYAGAADRQKVLLNELDALPPARRDTIVVKQRAIVDVVAGLLASIDPVLAADPVRARAQAMLLFGMINWTHTWFDPAGSLSPADIADMALTLVIGGHPAPRAAARRTPRRAQAS